MVVGMDTLGTNVTYVSCRNIIGCDEYPAVTLFFGVKTWDSQGGT